MIVVHPDYALLMVKKQQQDQVSLVYISSCQVPLAGQLCICMCWRFGHACGYGTCAMTPLGLSSCVGDC